MKKIFFSLILLLSIVPSAFCYITDYDLKGNSLGGTKIMGNLKVQMKAKAKRLSGVIVYQEAGNPMPDMDEKEIIIDYKKNKKYFFSMESGQWLSSSLKDDYALIDNNSINVAVKKNARKITATININNPPEFGGKQKYTINLTYSLSSPVKEIKQIKTYGKSNGLSVLSMFIDNEKIIEALGSKLGDDRYRIPVIWQIILSQDGQTKLDVKGIIQAILPIPVTDRILKRD